MTFGFGGQWGFKNDKEAGGSFILTFRNSRFTEEDIDEMELNDRQKEAVRYVKKHGKITNREYREKLGLPNRTALRDLSELCDKGILQKLGATGRGA